MAFPGHGLGPWGVELASEARAGGRALRVASFVEGVFAGLETVSTARINAYLQNEGVFVALATP